MDAVGFSCEGESLLPKDKWRGRRANRLGGGGETKKVVSTWQTGNGKNRLGRAECALAVCQSGNHFLYLLD